MLANPNIEFNYVPEWTMGGILYNGDDGIPRFYDSRYKKTHTVLPPQGIGYPVNICSSSNGLVASHNPTSNIYYIWNLEHHDSFIALPVPPRQHNASSTHVVLAVELDVDPCCFHLICATREDVDPIGYNFDMYNSLVGGWSSNEAIDVGGLIVPNTGISCGIFAYWLTEEPWSVIRFHVYKPHVRWQCFPTNACNPVRGTRFQLGKVRNQLGLVSVDNCSPPRITLYLLQEEGFPVPWQQYTDVPPRPILNHMLPLCPIRFESCKFEVCFQANGRLMIWEASIDEPQRFRVRFLDAAGPRAADGFAYISSTRCLPELFPVVY